MKVTNKTLRSIEASKKRQDQIAAGAYDGRFRQRTIKSKRVYSRKNYKINV